MLLKVHSNQSHLRFVEDYLFISQCSHLYDWTQTHLKL